MQFLVSVEQTNCEGKRIQKFFEIFRRYSLFNECQLNILSAPGAQPRNNLITSPSRSPRANQALTSAVPVSKMTHRDVADGRHDIVSPPAPEIHKSGNMWTFSSSALPVPILYPKTKELSADSAKLLKYWGGIPGSNR